MELQFNDAFKREHDANNEMQLHLMYETVERKTPSLLNNS